MSSEENKKIAKRFFECANQGDLETSMALLADDVKWTDIGSTRFAGTYHGKDALQNDLLGPLFSQLKAGIFSTVGKVIGDGDYVVVQSSGLGETLDGQPYNNHYCHIFRFRNGRICEVEEFCDTALVNRVFSFGDSKAE